MVTGTMGPWEMGLWEPWKGGTMGTMGRGDYGDHRGGTMGSRLGWHALYASVIHYSTEAFKYLLQSWQPWQGSDQPLATPGQESEPLPLAR